MADESVATLPVESAAVETAKQEALPVEQSTVESQSTGTPQVEGVDKAPQVQEQTRPQYDGLFRQERKRIRRLEETNSQLLNKLTEFEKLLKPKDVPDEPLDPSLILTDPDKYLSARERKLMREIDNLRGEVTNWKQTQEMQAQERRGLEALEKLFPKTSPDSNETLEERINRDPERAERLKEFFSDPEMQAIANINTDKAIKLAIAELGLNESKPNPLVLKKSAMGGVGTGNPSVGGGKTSASEADLVAQLQSMKAQMEKTPHLRNDPKFQERVSEVKSALLRLTKK